MAVKARAEITLSSIRDVQSVTRYYLLQSSTSTAPAKPTKNPPGGNWVTSEPTYTSGSTNSLYFTDCTVFSDDTFVYSDVSLSSSYEAAKVAYNKADAASETANNAIEKVDNLQIGGRNLVIRTLYPSATSRPGFKGQVGSTSGRGTCTVAEHGIRYTLGSTINWQYIYFGNSSNTAAVDMLGLEPGETYTFSADASWKVLSSEAGMTDTTERYMGASLRYSNSTTGSFQELSSSVTKLLIPQAAKGTEMSGRIVNTFTVPLTAKRLYFAIRANDNTVSHYATGDYIEIRNVKLEKGSKATDWTPAPEDLDDAVTAAQDTADGKNTVYYQADAPSGGTYKTNDIWFDTDDENKMYHWNGSAWTAAPFGNAAFSNIDAGKVTTGTMSANRIKGDTLTLGGANNVDGMLKVYDANGTLVGSFTREGLMAIAGVIGGWTIGEEDLTGEWDVGTEHWMIGLSKAYGLRFKEVPQGGDPTTDWTREVQYNAGLASFSSKENSETYHGAIENYPGENGLRIYPKLIVGDHSSSEVTEISTDQIDTTKVRLTELWAHPLGYGDSFYMQQPLMIMADVVTISTGTSEKNITLCTIPAAYQSGYRIVPFVSRRYSSQSGTPSDTGDFYYAYYNSVTHNVHIKLANTLPSGTIFQFDYMIYAVPETT